MATAPTPTQPKKIPEVPTVDPNAPLKIDQEQPEENEAEEKDSKLFFIGIIFTAVVVIGSIVFLIVQAGMSKTETKVTQVSTPSPTPQGKVAFSKSDWTFEVLNGSGTAGAAKKTADKLQSLGYNVVSVGNADDSNHSGLELYVSQDKSDKKDDLLAQLKSDFNVASISGVLKNSTASAQIIVGK